MCSRGVVDLVRRRSGVGIPKAPRGGRLPACLFLLLTRHGSRIWGAFLPIRAWVKLSSGSNMTPSKTAWPR